MTFLVMRFPAASYEISNSSGVYAEAVTADVKAKNNNNKRFIFTVCFYYFLVAKIRTFFKWREKFQMLLYSSTLALLGSPSPSVGEELGMWGSHRGETGDEEG